MRGRSRDKERRTGRGHKLERLLRPLNGHVPQQLDHRGGRVRERAVGRGVCAEAGRQRTGANLVDLENLEPGARADHVDDGVDAADLVEVDLLGRVAVDPSLCLGQLLEGGDRPLADPFGQASLLNQADDVRRCPHDRGLLDRHLDLRRAEPTPRDRLGVDVPSANRQPLTERSDLSKVGAGVDQRAQRHIAGDAGEAVEPRDPRRVSHGGLHLLIDHGSVGRAS